MNHALQWMHALRAVNAELTFHDPDLGQKIRLMIEDVKVIVDNILGGRTLVVKIKSWKRRSPIWTKRLADAVLFFQDSFDRKVLVFHI